jgi:pimeloyl-ACP methyl ester carboxylesterase
MRLTFDIHGDDERIAAKDDVDKLVEPMTVDARAAFPQALADAGLATLARLATAAAAFPESYYRHLPGDAAQALFEDGHLRFPSALPVGLAACDQVHADILENRRQDAAVVVVPHWNAGPSAYGPLARTIRMAGLTSAVVTLAYHGRRQRPGSAFADHFVSANLGRTLRSVRQAVLDVRNVVDWLEARGYRRFGIVGVSLGSCIAGLVATLDPRLRASALVLTAGDFAECVWTGVATRHIRRGLEPAMTLDDLRSVWSPIGLETSAARLARPDHRMLAVCGRRDAVVLPHISERFFAQLRALGARAEVKTLDCGHYAMAHVPHSLRALAAIVGFLRKALAAAA